MVQDAGNQRYTVEQVGLGTRIIVKPKIIWIVVVFLLVWLIGWAAGEIIAFKSLLEIVMPLVRKMFGGISISMEFVDWFGLVFLLVWLSFWTYGGAASIGKLLEMVAGGEVIEVNRSEIALQRKILGIGRVKRYPAGEIYEVRPATKEGQQSMGKRGAKYQLEFDYGFETVGFGPGLNPEESQEILQLIYQKYPQYRPKG